MFVRGALLCAVAVVSTACSLATLVKFAAPEHGDEIVVPRYVVKPLPNPWKPGSLIAGAGRAEITPPPGYPTGGHGPAGSVARGSLTRLYARAFFFADTDGNALVLVSCELFGIPGGLSASVARNVALKWAKEGIVLPPAAVVVAATHTHQSPGNYLTAQTYNAFASNYPGFSPPLFDFLVERVSSAVDEAIKDAKENGAAILTIRSATTKPWLQLNRSPRTFLLNADAQAMMNHLNPVQQDDPMCQPSSERGEARRDWDLLGCPRLRAVDRTMTIVEIAHGNKTAGLLVFFALHPTVLDHRAPLYSSDAMGLATRAVETSWSPEQAREPVVGFFNGAEGDVVARRGWRDAREIHSLAAKLTAEVHRIRRLNGTPIVGTISVKRKIASSNDTCGPGVSLASRPMVGAPALGGGEDDRTAAHRLGWIEGIRDVARNGQGGKQPALDPQLIRTEPITEKVAPVWTFPARLPVTVVRLGSFTIGALPLEVSTATGIRVRRAMADAGAQGRVELVAMADEYAGYVTTPEEYAAQDYMGASTLWGPNQGPFMACLSAKALTAVAPTHKEKSVPEQRFDPGETGDEQEPKVLFGPAAVYERRSAPDEELEHVLLTRDHVPARNLPYFEWVEKPANASDEFGFTARRKVRVTRLSHGRSWQDEHGEFVIVLRQAPKAGIFQWAAIWLGPILDSHLPADRFQFHVMVPQPQPGGGTLTVSSCPFSVDETSSLLRPPIPPLRQCSVP